MTHERFNEGKPRLSFFIRSFRWVNHAIARVKEFGAIKYEEDNWKLGGRPDTEYWDSFFRHLDYYMFGEEYDKDSGCHHIGHMIWNLSALMELNYSDKPVIDKDLFDERCAYWREKKRVALAEQEEVQHRVMREVQSAADGTVIDTRGLDVTRLVERSEPDVSRVCGPPYRR